jgi:hypothetical protein
MTAGMGGGVPPKIMTPPGAGTIVDAQGNELLTEAQKAERREEFRDKMLMSIASSLNVIAKGVQEGFPRFDAAQIASANALSVIAAGMGHLGLVDVDEMEEAAKGAPNPADYEPNDEGAAQFEADTRSFEEEQREKEGRTNG